VISILADTSALVSLEIRNLVNLSSKFIQFSISTGVFEELREIAKFDDIHGKSSRDVLTLVESGIILVKPVNLNPKHAENIDLGEAEILTIAEPGNYDYIITDDVKAMPYMKSMAKVKVLTSAFVIRLLYDKGILSRQEALSSIKVISQSRDWYGGVLETISNRYFNDI